VIFNVNFNTLSSLIKGHLLVYELYRYQNARYNDKNYVRLVYTGYLIYSIILLKNFYKEFIAETEKEKLTKVQRRAVVSCFDFIECCPITGNYVIFFLHPPINSIT